MTNDTFLKFEASHYAEVVLFANRANATVEVVLARSQNLLAS